MTKLNGNLLAPQSDRESCLRKRVSGIAIAYLAVSVMWIGLTGERVMALFPALLPFLGAYKAWLFTLVTTVVLNWILVRERDRRDAIEQKLRGLAIYDPLTGLLNRAALVANLEKAIAKAEREAAKVGIVFVDLDGFKGVNDQHGHHVGDDLLVEVGKRLQGITRSADSASRYGGDEFVLLVDGDKGGGTEALARRVQDALSRPIVVRGGEVGLTASVGFAVYPDHGTEAEQIVRAADKAMYRVKGAGKNAVLRASVTATVLEKAGF